MKKILAILLFFVTASPAFALADGFEIPTVTLSPMSFDRTVDIDASKLCKNIIYFEPANTKTDNNSVIKLGEPYIYIHKPSNMVQLEPDFGPYMKNLTKLVKKNWNPPKKNSSRYAAVFFTVNKKGEVSNIKIVKSSGDKATDVSAIYAIESVSLPPLPKEYKGNDIDINFAFNYKVFDRK